ncbi:MAG: flagellar basal body-associated FliL family protein [Lachnospiraceae bacterium]|nr:flagellar basal body-associated FliL family protein [Lachnospiraceae bacterium]
MKKNLLSIIILALLVVNLVLTSVMMFSVMSTNKKTGAVVSDIASILKLELGEAGEGEAAVPAVSMEDTDVYNIEDEMTIPLTKGADGEEHYALVQVSLSMDTKNKDYKTYSATLDEKVTLIQGEIADVIGKYTADEIQPRTEEIKEEILSNIQEMYDSDFIYKITFSKLFVQ